MSITAEIGMSSCRPLNEAEVEHSIPIKWKPPYDDNGSRERNRHLRLMTE